MRKADHSSKQTRKEIRQNGHIEGISVKLSEEDGRKKESDECCSSGQLDERVTLFCQFLSEDQWVQFPLLKYLNQIQWRFTPSALMDYLFANAVGFDENKISVLDTKTSQFIDIHQYVEQKPGKFILQRGDPGEIRLQLKRKNSLTKRLLDVERKNKLLISRLDEYIFDGNCSLLNQSSCDSQSDKSSYQNLSNIIENSFFNSNNNTSSISINSNTISMAAVDYNNNSMLITSASSQQGKILTELTFNHPHKVKVTSNKLKNETKFK